MQEQDLLGDSITALFADHATPAAVRRAEKEGLDRALWRLVVESGFDKALAPENAGGSALSLSEVRSVFEACGRYAAPIPLGEAILAHGFAAACGGTLPNGVVTAASARVVDVGQVQAVAVPFGESADWVLAVPPDGDAFVFAASHAKVSAHPGFLAANECDMTWHLAGAQAAIKVPVTAEWRVAGAALRVSQIAGALDSLLELTTRYSQERSQFGRPLAKFQAIQQQIAVLAEDTFAARMASAVACDKTLPSPLGEGPGEGVLPIRSHVAAAKVVASEAASRACNIAHAIHGAMGITEEYDLQLFTRRLLAWRMQYGSESYWATQVGNALLQDGRKTWDFVRSA